MHDLSLESSLAANICWPGEVELQPAEQMEGSMLETRPELRCEKAWCCVRQSRFGLATYCSTECQLQLRKPIAWRDMHVQFYNDDEGLPPITGRHEVNEDSTQLTVGAVVAPLKVPGAGHDTGSLSDRLLQLC